MVPWEQRQWRHNSNCTVHSTGGRADDRLPPLYHIVRHVRSTDFSLLQAPFEEMTLKKNILCETIFLLIPFVFSIYLGSSYVVLRYSKLPWLYSVQWLWCTRVTLQYPLLTVTLRPDINKWEFEFSDWLETSSISTLDLRPYWPCVLTMCDQ